jgi:hypothetical protein
MSIINHFSGQSKAAAVLDRVSISAVWAGLGGGALRHGRGTAFWRGGDGLSVALARFTSFRIPADVAHRWSGRGHLMPALHMLYPLPGNPSDAGPDTRRVDVDATQCGNCEALATPAGSYRCQGAVPDLCTVRLCESCRQQCAYCGLDACVEHGTRGPDGLVCDACLDHWRVCRGKCGCEEPRIFGGLHAAA